MSNDNTPVDDGVSRPQKNLDPMIQEKHRLVILSAISGTLGMMEAYDAAGNQVGILIATEPAEGGGVNFWPLGVIYSQDIMKMFKPADYVNCRQITKDGETIQ